MDKRFVYADNAATTHVSSEVLEAMLPFLQNEYGNPSSIYALGRRAQKAVEEARAKVAAAIGAKKGEIFFTSGGSEADNWAVKGTLARLAPKGKNHVVTSVFEHHALLHTVEHSGCPCTYVPVDSKGLVDPAQVRAAIRPDTAIVSIMFANNEIGTIQPIEEIAAVCREAGVLFHTDAVQAAGNVEIDVERMGIDMLSLSGHKIHAPKGVGALYCKRRCLPQNLIDGGGQEGGHRAGTENTAGIVGFGRAIELAAAGIPEKVRQVSRLRDQLISGLTQVEASRLNGDPVKRLCGNVNISFEGVEGESLLLMLDNRGICASSGSACTSGSLDPSHVLLAIGLSHEVAHGSLRLSISEETTEEDVAYILENVPPIVERLRAMSPLWERLQKN
ncbi:MAG: cysteine desulfurase NifS [Provencibacterium sp.]|jgi:cysteine desulfurase|nr:cysteine desulfurase NifS [Provencibacterium sp.]